MARTPTPSVASIPQTAPQVKFAVKLTPALPDGVTMSPDGLWLEKTCPACGATIKVENTPKAVAWIAARNRTCRSCDEDMRANLLTWTPPEEAGDFDYTAAWTEYHQLYCEV